jgi:cell division protease FtsH
VRALLGEASHGAQEDLAEATRLSCAMLGSLGLSGPSPLTHLGDPRRAEEFLRHVDIRAAVGIELAEADRACRELLEANRTALIASARLLFKRGNVGGGEIAALLEAARSQNSPKPVTPERAAFLRLVDDPGRREGP